MLLGIEVSEGMETVKHAKIAAGLLIMVEERLSSANRPKRWTGGYKMREFQCTAKDSCGNRAASVTLGLLLLGR